ncbi:MAG: hypothetical protein EHM23_24550 [Acidobacteria bacterium]|nr:MAG: hypothetical protein EHM23_24550 [Acidobacteriota bacterium]
MALTYDELKHKTVAELREMAAGLDHPAVQGHTQMNKEHLLDALCQALSITKHVQHDAKGVDKAALKQQIKELKKQRDTAIQAHDQKQIKSVRRQIHDIKVKLHRATV